MSYAQVSRPHDSASLDVGARAYVDPVLAKASLDAAKIVETMAKAPATRRLSVMSRELKKLDATITGDVGAEMRAQLKRGVTPDRAAFDAMRVTLANRRMDASLERVRLEIAGRYGWDAATDTALGTISASDRQAGCIAAATGSTVGGALQVIPVYGTIIGGIMGIGGSIAGQALDCGRETREAAAATAAAQAREAQARLDAAAAQASLAQRAAQSRQRLFLVGGGILGAVLLTAWILK